LALLLTGVLMSCGERVTPTKPQASKPNCGAAKLWHDEDLSASSTCQVIEGDLELGGALHTAKLGRLREVHGSLIVGPSYQLNNLSDLANLELIEGDLIIRDNMVLRGVFLGALKEVVGSVKVLGNAELRTLSLHSLRSVGGGFEVTSNRALSRLDVSVLESLGGGQVTNAQRKELQEAVPAAPLY
jgi:hypothetical protein